MSSSSSDHAESSDSDSSTLSNDTDDGQEAAKPSAEGLRNELHLAKQLWDENLDQLLSRIDGFEQLGRRLDRIERRTKRTANLSDSPEPNAWLSKNTRIILSPPSNDSSNKSDSSYEEDSSAATSNDDYTDGPSASDGEEGTGDELDLPEEDPALLALNHVKQTHYELVDRVGTRKRQRRGKGDVLLDKLRDDIVRCGQKISKQKAKRIQELEKENTRMKEAIKKVVSYRPELAGDLYGDPIVPLDIMSIVGQFLSGDNAYASLAKYSLTCRALREELQPMLYETVILHEDDPDRNKVFSSGCSLRPAFTHVKYLIGGDDFLNLSTGGLDLFPDLRVSINTAPENGSITIHKSINITTFAALMHILQFTKSEDGQLMQGWGTVLPFVTIEDGVWVLKNDAAENVPYVIPRLSTVVTPISRTAYILNHMRATPQLRQTLSNLFRFSLSSDGIRMAPVGRQVAPEWNFVLVELEEPISNGFYPAVVIVLNDERQLKLAALQETMTKAAAMYQRLFQLVSKSGQTRFTSTGPFYRVEHERESGAIFQGLLRRTNKRHGFTMRVDLIDGETRELLREETFRTDSLEAGRAV